MELKEYKVMILQAPEGMFLTQKTVKENDVRMYIKQITVTDETKDDYREATEDEKIEFEKQQEENVLHP